MADPQEPASLASLAEAVVQQAAIVEQLAGEQQDAERAASRARNSCTDARNRLRALWLRLQEAMAKVAKDAGCG